MNKSVSQQSEFNYVVHRTLLIKQSGNFYITISSFDPLFLSVCAQRSLGHFVSFCHHEKGLREESGGYDWGFKSAVRGDRAEVDGTRISSQINFI